MFYSVPVQNGKRETVAVYFSQHEMSRELGGEEEIYFVEKG